MQEVKGFIGGERDYAMLKGDTGPLVYPAGFVYIYSLLYKLTDGGSDIKTGQYIFAGLYILTMWVVFNLYRRSRYMPPYVLMTLVLSKRLHSIYVLRLFNDPFAMLFLYLSLWALIDRKYTSASVLFSTALSIKMNILLFFPAFALVLFKARGIFKTVTSLSHMAMVQLVLGLPFLATYPYSYFSRAFDFSRIFLYKWTVNWKFVPEDLFYSRNFAIVLLAGHLVTLVCFVFGRWLLPEGGLRALLRHAFTSSPQHLKTYAQYATNPEHVLVLCFTSNLIGMLFARSLHYQFYSWIAHSLPFLVWHAWSSDAKSRNVTWMETIGSVLLLVSRLGVMAASEWAWNVYPATPVSSGVVVGVFAYVLLGLWFAGTLEAAVGFGMLRGTKRKRPVVRRPSQKFALHPPIVFSDGEELGKSAPSSPTTVRTPRTPVAVPTVKLEYEDEDEPDSDEGDHIEQAASSAIEESEPTTRRKSATKTSKSRTPRRGAVKSESLEVAAPSPPTTRSASPRKSARKSRVKV